MYSRKEDINLKLNSFYLNLEKKIDAEIKALTDSRQQIKEQLNNSKAKMENLTELNRLLVDAQNNNQAVEDIKSNLYKSLTDKQLELRFETEKELLLKAYFTDSPASFPTLVELNKEHMLRKKMIEAGLLARFLIEEEGYDHFKATIEIANSQLDSALDIGESEQLEKCVDTYQAIFIDAKNSSEVIEERKESFKNYCDVIKTQMDKASPFVPDNVASQENFADLHQQVQKKSRTLETEVDKFLYQFSMLQRNTRLMNVELRKVRFDLEDLVFKMANVKERKNQLQNFKKDLETQREKFAQGSIDAKASYEDMSKELELIEKRFQKITTGRCFDSPKILQRLFTMTKTKSERLYIKEEKTNYYQVLSRILENPNIPGHQKRNILRQAQNSELINTHTGKFFFQRKGSTTTRLMIDDYERKTLPENAS